MIHSLAGGSIKNVNSYNFAKVQITEGLSSGGIFWYITDIPLSSGDNVIVPLGKSNALTRGVVLRVDKNVSAYSAPVPVGSAKRVYNKVD